MEHYNDGITPFKDFFRYKGLIKELADDLKLQTLLLRNTCEQLLTGVVETDAELVRKEVLEVILSPFRIAVSCYWQARHLIFRLVPVEALNVLPCHVTTHEKSFAFLTWVYCRYADSDNRCRLSCWRIQLRLLGSVKLWYLP